MRWERVRLGDVTDSCLGKMLDRAKNKGEYQPYLANVDVRWGSFNLDDLSEMRFEDDERERYGLKYGDLVICEGGEPGRCAIWKDQIPNMKIQKALHRVRVHDCLDYRFLYYWFLLAGKTGALEQYFTGTTIKHMPGEKLKSVLIDMPPIEVQRHIANILWVYDDLIENNQKQIKLLEEAAQRLYKEWFVDLRFPGHETTPIVDGVPEGWHEGTIQDVVIYHDKKRKPLSGMQRAEMQGEYRYYGAASILDYVNDYLFDGTYLLLGEDGTVVTEDGFPVLQYVTGKFWVNNHAHVLTGQPGYPTEYLYMMFKSTKVKDVVTGAAQPKISQARLSNKKIIVPSKQLVSAYCDITGPMFKDIINLEHQITVLKEARDRLLPKLMSGEIEV